MLTIFIFISCSTFYSKVQPFIELVFFLKQGLIFYCSIVFIIILYKKWGLEFLIKLFLKGKAHNCTSSKNCHCGSCQCSVDPVLSSHDAPYFETYLSGQALIKVGHGAIGLKHEVAKILTEMPLITLLTDIKLLPLK